MASDSARHGKRIASKACDVCRIRKCQCIFDDDAVNCRKCIRSNLQCTFLRDQKIRGPRAHRFPHELPQVMGSLYMEQFCPLDMLHRIMHDFNNFVYPLVPLVHKPGLQASLEIAEFRVNSLFFRRCLAICAITVASIPSNEAEYCGKVYENVQGMVDRACDLVALSRIATEPAWQDNPNLNLIIDSTLLAMASFYSGRPFRGWSLINDAIVAFRNLQLHRPEAYSSLTAVDAELSKRVFWTLHILQVYDQLSSITPHTVIGFPPVNTDWDLLIPLEVSDEQLIPDSVMASCPTDGRVPVITGFASLIRVFLCLRDVLSSDVSWCLRTYPRNIENFGFAIPPAEFGEDWGKTHRTPHQSLAARLQAAREMRENFTRIMRNLPEELQFPPPLETETLREDMQQFDIARATLHITSLYLQSTLVENLFNSQPPPRLESISSTGSPTIRPGLLPLGYMQEHIPTAPPEVTIQRELWSLREDIAQNLLDILDRTPTETLERNGFSLVLQIRKVAATLLDHGDDPQPPDLTEGRVASYIHRFAEILANLDHTPSFMHQEV